MPWLVAPSSFQAHPSALFPWSHLLPLTLTTLPASYEDPGDYIEPTQIIPDNLSISGPLTSLHLQSSFFATRRVVRCSGAMHLWRAILLPTAGGLGGGWSLDM